MNSYEYYISEIENYMTENDIADSIEMKALKYILAQALFLEQASYYSILLENNPFKAQNINSVLTYAADHCYYVTRGYNPRITISGLVATSTKTCKKYDTCTSVSDYKLVYADTYELSTNYSTDITLIVTKSIKSIEYPNFNSFIYEFGDNVSDDIAFYTYEDSIENLTSLTVATEYDLDAEYYQYTISDYGVRFATTSTSTINLYIRYLQLIDADEIIDLDDIISSIKFGSEFDSSNMEISETTEYTNRSDNKRLIALNTYYYERSSSSIKSTTDLKYYLESNTDLKGVYIVSSLNSVTVYYNSEVTTQDIADIISNINFLVNNIQLTTSDFVLAENIDLTSDSSYDWYIEYEASSELQSLILSTLDEILQTYIGSTIYPTRILYQLKDELDIEYIGFSKECSNIELLIDGIPYGITVESINITITRIYDVISGD